MTSVTLHFQGTGSEVRPLEAVPRRGDYLTQDGQLWQVAAVVFDASNVNAYAVRLSDDLAEATRQAWATWGDTAAPVEPAETQRGLFAQ
jgi:hypothetical protein